MKANALDLDAGAKAGLSDAFLDRLAITDKVVAQMVEGLRQIASLRDPIGEVVDIRPQPSGIEVGRMRTPLGVVAIIYESRPNVTLTPPRSVSRAATPQSSEAALTPSTPTPF